MSASPNEEEVKNDGIINQESKVVVNENNGNNASVSTKKTYQEIKEERKRNLKLRRQQKREHKEAGISNDILKQTQYYFENGLRKVYPYYFGWNTTAKERWFTRTIYDIYSTEFSRAIRNQPLLELIETGKIRVNGQIKSKDYVIKNGDRISHVKHRHEIPVLDDEIKIIHEDDDYLVLDKPCSLPMHPCGKYRYNTLSSILTKEMGFNNLRTQYRLDRLTSGIVIMGKNFKSALFLDKHIKDRTAVKTYLARVVGEFPKEKLTVDAPIDCASRKVGLYWVDKENGKESLTEFERVSYNGKTSVVLCYPKTGRTHQIRIHLQYLGHPIVNDPLYNQPDVWGEGNGKSGQYGFSKDQIEMNFLNVHTYESWIIKQESNETDGEQQAEEKEKMSPVHNSLVDDKSKEAQKRKEEAMKDSEKEDNEKALKKARTEDESNQQNSTLQETKMESVVNISQQEEKIEVKEKEDTKEASPSSRPGFDKSLVEIDPDCFECKQVFRDPVRSDLIMYLHAYSYKFGDLVFKTEYPEWAKEEFVESS